MNRILERTWPAALLLAIAPPSLARAEHCAGRDDRPAVCTVEFYGALAGQRPERFDPQAGLELPPGQRFELELEALDQNGRLFPEARLAFDYDDVDCSHLVEVSQEDLGRFTLRPTAQGACDLWLWVPGDLNLEWRLRLATAPRSRTGYSRAEAELVAKRLYQAVLGREAEPEGLRGAVLEIQRGNLEGRTIDMLRSSEYRAKAAGRTPNELLEQLYRGLFGRPPDSAGVQAFLPMLQRGQTAVVVREMLQSEEFERLLAGVGEGAGR